jgi:predicted aldo/keto reductase-like oxidoreductase
MSIKDLIEHDPGRRSFLKTLAVGTAAAVAVRNLPAVGQERPGQAPILPPGKIIKDGMVYRRLGRTGLHISEIALGGSPLPDERLLFRLIERGINYLDVSESYENGNVERLAGRAFKAFSRDRIMVATRFHLKERTTETDIIASVEGSLRRLETDHIEVLGIHGVEDPKDLTDERVLGAFEKLKAQGKFLFRGVTCHINQHAVIPEAVACGLYDMVQIGYNVFDIQETEKDVRAYSDYLGESGVRRLIDLAAGKDVGVTAMKVLKVGGRRQDLAGYATGGATLFQAMLKWALADDRVAAVVTEILNESQMEEDLAVVGRPLTVADRRILHDHVAANARGTCHFCGQCQAACPAGVRTADISRCLAYAESYGKTERARSEFREIPDERGARACRDCGACERACPYGLSVRDRTRRASGLFA